MAPSDTVKAGPQGKSLTHLKCSVEDAMNWRLTEQKRPTLDPLHLGVEDIRNI